MNQQEKEVLSRIVSKAKDVTPSDATIILFGSRARGVNRADSDWDLLVLLNKDKISLNDIDEVAYPIREMGWSMDADINPVLYTRKEWDNSSFTPFYKNVTKEGIVL